MTYNFSWNMEPHIHSSHTNMVLCQDVRESLFDSYITYTMDVSHQDFKWKRCMFNSLKTHSHENSFQWKL